MVRSAAPNNEDEMKFVVVVPWWLYAIFVVVAVAIGGAIMYAGLFLLLIYVFFKSPGTVIGLILLGLSFRYWQVTVPLLIALLIYLYFQKKSEAISKTSGLDQVMLKDTLKLPQQNASDPPPSSNE